MFTGPRLAVVAGAALLIGSVALIVMQSRQRDLLPDSPGAIDEEARIAAIIERHQAEAPPLVPGATTRGGDATGVSRSNLPRIDELPQGPAELRQAFVKNERYRCQLLSPGELLRYAPPEPDAGQAVPPVESVVLSVGLRVSAGDVRGLPALSKGTILAYLRDQFIGVQVPLGWAADGAPVFGDRVTAGFCAFAQPKLCAAPNGLIVASVHDIRVLGVFSPSAGSASRSRTLVLIHGHRRAVPATSGTVWGLEYVFIHAPPVDEGAGNRGGDNTGPQVFVTSDDRTRLHRIKTGSPPPSVGGCDVQADIMFTKYDYGGQVPSASAVRRTAVIGEDVFPVAELDRIADTIAPGANAWERLPEVLDQLVKEASGTTR